MEDATPSSTFVVQRQGEDITVTGGLTAKGETTQAITYAGVRVRLCLQYTIPGSTGRVDIADAPCDPEVAPHAPPGNTVTLED